MLFGLDRIGMSGGNSEEEMYKELFLSMMDNSVTSIANNDVTAINSAGRFANLTNLTSVSLPNLTSIGVLGDATFQNCTSLTSVNLPNLAYNNGQSQTFWGCTSLVSISLPAAVRIGNNMFYGCTNLETVTMNAVVNVTNGPCLNNCKKLKDVYLRSMDAATLKAISAFPFTNNYTAGYAALTFHCASSEKITWDGSVWNIEPDT